MQQRVVTSEFLGLCEGVHRGADRGVAVGRTEGPVEPGEVEAGPEDDRGEDPVTEVAQVLGVSRATLYRRVPELVEAQRKRQAPVQRDVPMAG